MTEEEYRYCPICGLGFSIPDEEEEYQRHTESPDVHKEIKEKLSNLEDLIEEEKLETDMSPMARLRLEKKKQILAQLSLEEPMKLKKMREEDLDKLVEDSLLKESLKSEDNSSMLEDTLSSLRANEYREMSDKLQYGVCPTCGKTSPFFDEDTRTKEVKHVTDVMSHFKNQHPESYEYYCRLGMPDVEVYKHYRKQKAEEIDTKEKQKMSQEALSKDTSEDMKGKMRLASIIYALTKKRE